MTSVENWMSVPGNFRCPWCDTKNDRALATDGSGSTPKPGDLSFCHHCAGPMYVQDIGQPRRPTDDEWASINDSTEYDDLRLALFKAGGAARTYTDPTTGYQWRVAPEGFGVIDGPDSDKEGSE